MNADQLYARLPIWAQNLSCNLEGYHIQRSRFSKAFYQKLDTAKKRASMSNDELLALQGLRLREYVCYCAKYVPYYRRNFREWGVDPETIHSMEDLAANVPTLSKDEVKRHVTEFYSEVVPPAKRTMIHTSGTTGSGLRFATTLDAVHEQWAVWWRYRKSHGLQIGTWCGYFGGRSVVPVGQKHPPYWRYNGSGKQILFSGYHLSPTNMDYYVAELERRKTPWLHGYPSIIALLASHMLERGMKISYPVRWVTIGAESLMPHQTMLIKQAFGVKPLQHYGLAEAVANASECEYGRLHVDEDFSAVELLPVAGDPSARRIIGTNFSNPAFALLRYDTQDIATPVAYCGCGRPGRVFEAIDGRQEDYVTLADGTKVGRLDHIFKDLVNIREAQIYQEVKGTIEIRVVRGEGFTSRDEILLKEEARKRLGQIDLRIKYEEKIERTRTGKLRFVVSSLIQDGIH